MLDVPVSYLNSNDGSSILAFGQGASISSFGEDPLEEIQDFIDTNKGEYIFVALSYELKNHIEMLHSKNSDHVQFPEAILWVPKYVMRINGNTSSYLKGEKNTESESFLNKLFEESQNSSRPQFAAHFEARTDKASYLKTLNSLKEELRMGNIYEVNYCQEYFCENVDLNNSLATYSILNRITQAPFSCYFNFANHTVMCGSPERFLQKKGNTLKSSPIKGTKKRGLTLVEDEKMKSDLLNDPKERSENVMIVDLVRNDLSKVAKSESVKVDELFGIYTFETVHQMISTISCEVRANINFTDILKATFPMGSMTGAPKISAMKIIEEHEDFQRGIYSGSIGYIEPNGDFDLNVVIRSLVYNKEKQYLSCSVGSAITINSSPENEYEECLLKIQRIIDGLNE